MIEILKNTKGGNSVRLIASDGRTFDVTWDDFWGFCNDGDKYDTKREVLNYLSDIDRIEGIESDKIAKNNGLIDDIVCRVLEERIGNECGDQIYDSVVAILPRMKKQITKEMIANGIRTKVITFADDPNAETGIICKIGGNFFNFGGKEGAEDTSNAYLLKTSRKQLVNEIYTALSNILEDSSYDDELREEYNQYHVALQASKKK